MRDPLILWSAAFLSTLLVVAWIVTEVLARTRPQVDATELRVRIRSWWIMLVVLESALYAGKLATVLLFACVSFFALREYLSRVPTRAVDRQVLFWVFLAIPIQFYLVYHQWLVAALCFVPLYGLSVIALRLLLTGQPRGFVMALSTFQLGLLSTVYSVGHLAYLTLLGPPGGTSTGAVSAGVLLYLICITQLNDVFQFITGKTLGRQKIVPLISPKKTVEGFCGGLLLSCIASSMLAPLLTPLNPLEGMLAGLLLAVLGFFGDLLMSAIKRDLGIKDFSQIIPGHSGVLDRIDSLVIAAPLYFHVLRLVLSGPWLEPALGPFGNRDHLVELHRQDAAQAADLLDRLFRGIRPDYSFSEYSREFRDCLPCVIGV